VTRPDDEASVLCGLSQDVCGSRLPYLLNAPIHIFIDDSACLNELGALRKLEGAQCLSEALVAWRDVGDDGRLRVAPKGVLEQELQAFARYSVSFMPAQMPL
jgi:hypothetical protein